MGNLAGMAAILEQKRQREEAAAKQREMEAGLERLQQEQQKTEAKRAAAMAKAEDDRRRKGMSANFGGGRVGAAGSGSKNPFSSGGNDTTAQACVERQSRAVEEYVAAAQQCLVNTRLISSFNDDPYIERGTDPNNWGRLTPPRWKISGNRASPVCNLPLKVENQYESFAECARVHMCAVRAAQCTAQTVARTGDDCVKTANACLARYPVPTDVAELQRSPSTAVPFTGPGARKSHQGGISGPSSGRGGSAPRSSRAD